MLIDYQTYLGTYDWQIKCIDARKRAGYRCQVCNSPIELEVHHRTYERLGNELPGDLTVLCADCHEAVKDRLPSVPYFWLKRIGIEIQEVAHD